MQENGGIRVPAASARPVVSDAEFSQVVGPELPRLRRIVSHVAGEDAALIEQNVLIRLWFSFPTVHKNHPHSLAAWFRTTAVRLVIDEARRRRAEPLDFCDELPEDARVTRDVAEDYAVREDLRAALTALAALRDPVDRTLVMEHAVTGDSATVLGLRHGLSAAAVQKRLERARKKMSETRVRCLVALYLYRMRFGAWLRSRRVDPAIGVPATALSFTMTGVMFATSLPSAGAGTFYSEHSRPRRSFQSGASGPAMGRGLSGRQQPGGTLRSDASSVSRPATAKPIPKPAAKKAPLRVTTCVPGTQTCASLSHSDPDDPQATDPPGDEVYVDLPPQAGGRTSVTENAIRVCDESPTPPTSPAGCKHHP